MSIYKDQITLSQINAELSHKNRKYSYNNHNVSSYSYLYFHFILCFHQHITVEHRTVALDDVIMFIVQFSSYYTSSKLYVTFPVLLEDLLKKNICPHTHMP